MSAMASDFPYLPGKRLECLCGRGFATERGLKQHIRRPMVVASSTLRHGRCLGVAGQYLVKTLIRRSSLKLMPSKL